MVLAPGREEPPLNLLMAGSVCHYTVSWVEVGRMGDNNTVFQIFSAHKWLEIYRKRSRPSKLNVHKAPSHSTYGMRTSRNFLLTQMPETMEADEDDDGGKSKEPIAKVFSTWDLDAINLSLDRDQLTEGSRKHKNSVAMNSARDLTHLL